MSDRTEPLPLRFSRLLEVQVQALESLLNDLGTHGLRVCHEEGKQWRWEWQGCSALADGMGSAIVTAAYWYFGLLSDKEASVTKLDDIH